MFIQDCPGELDDKHGQPFYGKTCNKLRTLLESHGITSKDVFFTSLVKCIADKEEPKPANVEACRDLIEAEIAVVDPDIIVPTGNKSLRFCVGRVGITKMRGNAQEVELCGRTRIILPTMHPPHDSKETCLYGLYHQRYGNPERTEREWYDRGFRCKLQVFRDTSRLYRRNHTPEE